jgi:hypothetical protein
MASVRYISSDVDKSVEFYRTRLDYNSPASIFCRSVFGVATQVGNCGPAMVLGVTSCAAAARATSRRC